ncbi:MAG TPA: glycosyltransferase family 4 protein, partial [Solirubrobacteraceae bacterium]|nr:glycosyltransferase family 4 protein [Solirubrobacteraceae bacterium]
MVLVSYEVDGITRNGGIGTATSALAEALGAAGHDVRLVYSGAEGGDPEARGRCARRYAAAGVELEVLADDSALRVAAPHYNARRAWDVYRRLLELNEREPLDVVHFPECQGHGYYALLAKHHGVAFGDVTLCVHAHSSTRWSLDAGAQEPRWVGHLVDDRLERRCIELADVLVSPTAYLLSWLERNGLELPERALLAPYLLPRNVARADPVPRGPVDELVFFGRLEARKGLVHFCDALDQLAADGGLPVRQVTFLGRHWRVGTQRSEDFLAERTAAWPWRVRVIDDLQQAEAVAYLTGPGRLAVMPSLVDNSPNAVIEAIALGVPFVASRRGGTAELIDPDDRDACTFDPLEGAAEVDVGDAAGMARAARSAPLA